VCGEHVPRDLNIEWSRGNTSNITFHDVHGLCYVCSLFYLIPIGVQWFQLSYVYVYEFYVFAYGFIDLHWTYLHPLFVEVHCCSLCLITIDFRWMSLMANGKHWFQIVCVSMLMINCLFGSKFVQWVSTLRGGLEVVLQKTLFVPSHIYDSCALWQF
jgi:hypothetical protein